MATENDFKKVIADFQAESKKRTLAELIATVWADKVVEVYIGDTFEDIKYDDSTQKYAAILVGKVVAAYAECLILNCVYVDQLTKQMRYGNLVALNERAVRTITEVDESGILKDTFLSSRDGKVVKEVFGGKK